MTATSGYQSHYVKSESGPDCEYDNSRREHQLTKMLAPNMTGESDFNRTLPRSDHRAWQTHINRLQWLDLLPCWTGTFDLPFPRYDLNFS
jgi:hypothetical protein